MRNVNTIATPYSIIHFRAFMLYLLDGTSQAAVRCPGDKHSTSREEVLETTG
jgi:hypothetical protein